ncbi:MAG: hypothetical protein HYZ53_04995 [Planctomycetes bacterium]|nr:hypothetical protein [Planctomycetota bacterium]
MVELRFMEDQLRRMEQIVSTTEAQSTGFLRTRYVMCLVVVFLVLYMYGLFEWTRGELLPYLKPEESASMISAQIVTQINNFEESAPGYVKEHADDVAQLLTQAILDYAPVARRRVEGEIDQYMDSLLSRFDTDMQRLVHDQVTGNGDEIRATFEDFQRQHTAKRLVKQIEEKYENELNTLMSKDYANQIKAMDDEMVALATADPATLSHEQKLEREVFCLLSEGLKRAKARGDLDAGKIVEEAGEAVKHAILKHEGEPAKDKDDK